MKVDSLLDKLFILIFADGPMLALMITPIISIFYNSQLVYFVNKSTKVDFGTKSRIYSNSLIFGWLLGWFLCLNWVKRSYGFYENGLISDNLFWRLTELIVWVVELLSAIIVFGMVLEVQNYMRGQEKDHFVSVDEYIDETPRVVLLFLMIAIVYSLYEIF